jgi:hypothetical protein
LLDELVLLNLTLPSLHLNFYSCSFTYAHLDLSLLVQKRFFLLDLYSHFLGRNYLAVRELVLVLSPFSELLYARYDLGLPFVNCRQFEALTILKPTLESLIILK